MEYWLLANEEELARQFEQDGPALSWDEFLLAEYVAWLSSADEIERYLKGWETGADTLLNSSGDARITPRRAA